MRASRNRDTSVACSDSVHDDESDRRDDREAADGRMVLEVALHAVM